MPCRIRSQEKPHPHTRTGGGRSPISAALDGFLQERGWQEKSFDIQITNDGNPVPIPTHKTDDFKNEVGLEIEWNNKTEFYDRDLNNFRLLKELRVLAVGVMVTRMSELQELFNKLGTGKSYGASVEHWDGGPIGCSFSLGDRQNELWTRRKVAW
jgi:hypothetical protein